MFTYQVYGVTLQINQPLSALIPLANEESIDLPTGDLSIALLREQAVNSALMQQLPWTTIYDNDIESHRSIIQSAEHRDGCYIKLRYSGDNGLGLIEWLEYVIDPTGRQVWVTWAAPDCEMEAFLLGPVLACVMTIRGHICLHASVIETGDGCIAILGAKGAGKSTTAAAFSQLGHRVLADDLAVLVEQGNDFLVPLGYPRLRLNPDAAMAVVGTIAQLTRVFEEDVTAPGKLYLNLPQRMSAAESPRQLQAIYLLHERNERLQVPFITPLDAATAVMTLVQHTSASMVLTKAARAREFVRLSQLVKQIPLRSVHRPDTLQALSQLCELIARDARSSTGTATVPTSTLAALLPPLLAELPPALAQPDARAAIHQTARHLAPIVSGGFECRLDDDWQVDLQQCITANVSQLALLHAHWTANEANRASSDPMWVRLLTFLEACRRPSSALQSTLSEIWLEYDADTLPTGISDGLPSESPNEPSHESPNESPLPLLFFGLKQAASSGCGHAITTEQALGLLLGDAFQPPWRANVQRTFAACANAVFVSHIGVMLSRAAPAVRVNIKRLDAETVGNYLTQVGWHGDPDEIAALMDTLAPHVDKFTLCLDVGCTIAPRVGLECILLEQPPTEVRWRTLLNRLAEWNLLLPEKQVALLQWPGQTEQANGSAMVRRLSHVKVDYWPNRPLRAKGYLWFHQKWSC